MKIIFSRHAKRRAKLYMIPLNTIMKILEEMEPSEGAHEIIREVEGMSFPLKIVVAVKNQSITVVTNYPLKRGKQA